MNGIGDQFFSGSTLTENKHGGFGGSNQGGGLKKFLHCRAAANDIGEIKTGI